MRANSVNPDEVVMYDLPHLVLCSLKFTFFSFVGYLRIEVSKETIWQTVSVESNVRLG